MELYKLFGWWVALVAIIGIASTSFVVWGDYQSHAAFRDNLMNIYIIKQWVKYGEYLNVDIDTETGECTPIKVG